MQDQDIYLLDNTNLRFWIDKTLCYNTSLNKFIIEFSLIDIEKEKLVVQYNLVVADFITEPLKHIEEIIQILNKEKDLYLEKENTK